MAQSDPNIPRDDRSRPDALPADGELTEQIDDRWLSLIDAALKVQAPLADNYVTTLRRKHPGATDRQLLELVTKRFTTLTTAAGASIGGVAALPGLGTAAALGLTIGEGVTFAEACAFLTLAAAEIHGVDMADKNTRRLVLMGVLGGERGTEIIAKAMGKQGLQWHSVLNGGGGFVPGLISRQVSRYVRRRVVARTGKLWLMRLLPFGIGAVIGGFGARTVAKSVVEAMLEIFSQELTHEVQLAAERSALNA